MHAVRVVKPSTRSNFKVINLYNTMSNPQLTQSLKDILPTYTGKFPPALVSYIDSLYSLSIQKIPLLPNRADVARYHLCAYLGAKRCQDRFLLPEPLSQKIPVQPKFVDKLLDELEEKVIPATRSPAVTPTKKRTLQYDTLPLPLPTKKTTTPKISSPLKKLQALRDEDDSQKEKKFKMESPFNPSKVLLNKESPFNPGKQLTEVSNGSSLEPIPSDSEAESVLTTPKKSPSKKKLSVSATASPSSPRYIRHLTIADLISFANNFYIPAPVTKQLVEYYLSQKHKFMKKNEWLLACGIIHAAYIRINHRLIQHTIGKRTELQDQLFQYQKGGLMKRNMIMWINIVEESVKSEPWIIDLEVKYVHDVWSEEDTSKSNETRGKLGKGWELLQEFGAMIDPSVMFDKESQVNYYENWTSRIRMILDA